MIKSFRLGIGGMVVAWAVFGASEVRAQVGSGGPNQALPSTSSALSNPYLYMNPYLNPLATQPMSGNNALMFLYGANQARGGIGTGQISGTRGAAAKQRVAEMPYTAHPGGGASRYFNANAGVSVGAGRYYNQRGRYFQNNGR